MLNQFPCRLDRSRKRITNQHDKKDHGKNKPCPRAKEIHCYGFHSNFKITVYFYRYHTQLNFMKTSGDQKNTESEIIDSFLDSLWLEQGLSKSTLDAYRSDLKLLNKWAKNRELSLENISRPDLLEFIAYKAEMGSSARSSARMLSSLRRFYTHLMQQEIISINPSYISGTS